MTKGDVILPKSVQYIDKGPMKKFCLDYFARLKSISVLLSETAICCFVLADRTYKRQKFPLVEANIEYMESLGFNLVDKYDRFLSWKRLPRSMRYIHENEIAKHEGMNYESVVVFTR